MIRFASRRRRHATIFDIDASTLIAAVFITPRRLPAEAVCHAVARKTRRWRKKKKKKKKKKKREKAGAARQAEERSCAQREKQRR
jgi:O-acetyl-ADP-ribose deacetylase (regulator of RNase III)